MEDNEEDETCECESVIKDLLNLIPRLLSTSPSEKCDEDHRMSNVAVTIKRATDIDRTHVSKSNWS